MATQGMISIVRLNKHNRTFDVLCKISVGCNGFNVNQTADRIQACWPLSIESIVNICEEHGFGDEYGRDLVVITEDGYNQDGVLHRRYIETFQDPYFNPRWDRGTCEHIRVVLVR